MAEKNCFDMTKLIFQIMRVTVRYCGAAVKELPERAEKPGSTPGDAVFCFFVPFFSLFSLSFLTLFFLLAFFSLFLMWTLLIMHLDQYIF